MIRKGSSESRVVFGSHMRDSTAYPVLLGVTMGRNHGMLGAVMNGADKFPVVILKGRLVLNVGKEVTS